MPAPIRPNRWGHRLLTIVLWIGVFCGLFAGWSVAQDAGQVGGIRGKVIDEEFLTPIGDVVISAEGSGARVSSDKDGNFFLQGLNPGNYILLASREGYSSTRSNPVVVRGGEISEVTINLTGEVVDLDEFMVSPEEMVDAGGIAALDLKVEATSFKDVLGAEFISKLGASNVGAALVKSAGVSVVGGRYVVVRGLADRYNAVTLNGAGVPSSDPDKRAVNIDLFPASIVAGVDTSKTFSPDLPGEATGGSINIITKGIPDENFFKIKLGLGYDTLATGNARFLTYSGGGTGMYGTLDDRRIPDFLRNSNPEPLNAGIGTLEQLQLIDDINRTLSTVMGTTRKSPGPNFALEATMGRKFDYFGKPAGLLGGLDYRKDYRYDEDGFRGRYSFGLGGQVQETIRAMKVERGTETMRASILGVAGFKPNDRGEIKATVFHNKSAEDRATLQFGPTPSAGIYAYRESLVYTERALTALQLTGSQEFDAMDREIGLDWFMTYNQSYQNEPDQRFVETEVNQDFTEFTLPGALSIPPLRRYWRELDDVRYNLGASAEFPLAVGGEEESISIKTGMAFDHSSREYRADSFAYLGGNLPGPSYPAPFPGATPGDVALIGIPNAVDFFPVAATTRLYRFAPPETYDAEQNIPSAFLMAKADMTDKLNFAFGFRAEQTNIKIEAADFSGVTDSEELAIREALFTQEELAADPSIRVDLQDPIRGAQNAAIQARRRVAINEAHVLPAFSANYEMADNMFLRGAFSRTIARPSFKELAPVPFRDAETGDAFVGNALLNISDISNYDVRWEWLPESGGTVGVSFFSKFIENPIEKSLANGIEKFINEDGNAVVYGFELEHERDLSFLAEELKGFSIGGNYAWIYSNISEEDGEGRRLQGQPGYTFNFNLSYNHEDTGIYAGLFLNVTGGYLDAVGQSFNDPDLYVKPATTLNAVCQFDVGENGKISLRANNLTGTVYERYYDAPGEPIHTLNNSGTTYSLSYEHTF